MQIEGLADKEHFLLFHTQTLMNAYKENQDVIHRIDPESSEENSIRFDELVNLLEAGSDADVKLHNFHHSDLADAFGLLPRGFTFTVVRIFKDDWIQISVRG